MYFCATADFGHGQANGSCPVLHRGDNSLLIHNDANDISIIATLQEQSCKLHSFSDDANACPMDGLKADTKLLHALCEWTGLNPSNLARSVNVAVTTITRPYNSKIGTRLSQPTLDKLKAKWPDFPGWKNEEPDQVLQDSEIAYVPVEVLPTYGGMGGGGTGDGDRETALIPRALVVDVLRGQPKDFLLVNVRGDSMEPDFRHGDQILIDKRDVSPAQPGPFALWDGEWGEYVVKNVERSRSGEVRIFSSNPKYSSEKEPAENTRIIGRPVWFGRRL